MKKIITDKEIEKIVTMSFRNSTLQIKKLLSELPELKEDTLREDIRRLLRDKGRSNMINTSEIRNVLNEP